MNPRVAGSAGATLPAHQTHKACVSFPFASNASPTIYVSSDDDDISTIPSSSNVSDCSTNDWLGTTSPHSDYHATDTATRRPSSLTLRGTAASQPPSFNESDGCNDPSTAPSLALYDQTKCEWALKGWNEYRMWDNSEQIALYSQIRAQGYKIPYAPFEPEYDDQPVQVYLMKSQPVRRLFVALGLFVCFILGTGGLLTYRVWGMHVGYSPQWHWTDIHQDLRFDGKIWRAYVWSLILLIILFGAVIFTCVKYIGEIVWKDILVLGLIRVVELLGKGKNWAIGRKELMTLEKGRVTTKPFWDYDWEEKMEKKYGQYLWWFIFGIFLSYPSGLLIAYTFIILNKNKCSGHSWDVVMGFGY